VAADKPKIIASHPITALVVRVSCPISTFYSNASPLVSTGRGSNRWGRVIQWNTEAMGVGIGMMRLLRGMMVVAMGCRTTILSSGRRLFRL